jgi:hypothetical protein
MRRAYISVEEILELFIADFAVLVCIVNSKFFLEAFFQRIKLSLLVDLLLRRTEIGKPLLQNVLLLLRLSEVGL